MAETMIEAFSDGFRLGGRGAVKIGSFRFDRVEFAGSLGDLGTLIPLSVGLILITGLNLTSIFLLVGLFYILTGAYFHLPIPVQPLKVVAAIAIAFPDKITVQIISATGFIFGGVLLLLAWTSIIDWVARFFTKPIVRGIQFGLGFILLTKGIRFIQDRDLFIDGTREIILFAGIPVNPVLGILGVALVLFLLSSRRFPAALVFVTVGAAIGVGFGALKGVAFDLGPLPMKVIWPRIGDFWSALFLLVIPQIPLTLGNAIMGTTDTVRSLFENPEQTKRATHRGFATSMGFANIGVGILAGMPVCHGAGGLAAHYRFGARTGGSNMMIGLIFVVIAVVFGRIGINLLSAIPNAVLGVLLVFAGLELALLVRDVRDRKDLFVAFMIAGISLTTKNMGIAFVSGILIDRLIKVGRLEV